MWDACENWTASPAPRPEPTSEFLKCPECFGVIPNHASDCSIRPEPTPRHGFGVCNDADCEQCRVKYVTVVDSIQPEQPSPPVEARESAEQLADKWKADVKHYGCECSTAHLAEFAEAYAKKERERADAAERERDNVTTQWSIAADEVESLRIELREAKQRLQTFEDEHKRFLILSQTVVDLERELREAKKLAEDRAKSYQAMSASEFELRRELRDMREALAEAKKQLVEKFAEAVRLSRKGEGS